MLNSGRSIYRACCLALGLLLSNAADAQTPVPLTSAAATNSEAELALKQFRLPPNFKVELFASEPQLANPVAFTIDHQNRFYVAETYRHSAVGAAFRLYEGVFDVRSHMDWLQDDLAARTVEDRVAMYRKHLPPADFAKLDKLSEQIRLIEDRNGDGKADFSTIFANGFNQPADGIGAGVLAVGTNVYYTCIPDLWRLSDANGDGKADFRQSLHTGYGVHVNFLGHDLHGLTLGPDGRLYFSIGDRGINVTNREGRVLNYPDEGVVLRCELDGANLEVFHRGLRNPQELAFDEYGNLFTGDNNSDSGDRARLVHLVEGGDSGWRTGYQHLTAPPRRGPWNGEQLWRPQHEGQPAWIIPPVANLGYGPSGFTYYPGTGLNESYRGHFFLADFRGGVSSGIHTFTLKPKGASFELASYDQFVWDCLPTDVEFGPDGSLYFSDWVYGWNKTGKGRIYRVFDPTTDKSKEALETKKLLAEGMGKRSQSQLVELLGHRDMRVRMEAQFQLASIGSSAAEVLLKMANQSASQLARLHAIWGLQMLERQSPGNGPVALVKLLNDSDPVIRAAAAHFMGESAWLNAVKPLERLFRDPDANVRYHAIAAFGKLSEPSTKRMMYDADRSLAHQIGKLFEVSPTKRARIDALLPILKASDVSDPYMMHAVSLAFARNNNHYRIAELARPGEARAVRQTALLALRRMAAPEIDIFLKDQDAAFLLEAARAINDVPIDGAMPALAALISQPDVLKKFTALDATNASRSAGLSTRSSSNTPRNVDPSRASAQTGAAAAQESRAPGNANSVESAISDIVTETGSWTQTERLFFRVINANFRVGRPENATALVAFAARNDPPASLRAEAVNALSDWAKPSPLDRVMGMHRPLAARDGRVAIEALQPSLAALLNEAPEPVRLAVIQAAEKLGHSDIAPMLVSLISQAGAPSAVRSQALKTLSALKAPQLAEAVRLALQSNDAALQREAARLEAATNPDAAVARLLPTLDTGSVPDKQSAFAALASLSDPRVDAALAGWMDRLLKNEVPREVQLDLLAAAGARTSRTVLDRVQQFENARPQTFLAPLAETLHGGDAVAGRKLFFEREDIGCAKCHTLGGQGGVAGPNLTGIGARKDREYVLESITMPNAKFAEGWENVLVTLENGTTYAGRLKRETVDEVEIDSPEEGAVKFAKNKIKSRTRALSAMPDEFRQILGKQDLRNLIEFLAASK